MPVHHVALQGQWRRQEYMHACGWLYASRTTNIKRNKQVAFLGEADIEQGKSIWRR
jgi:hypothetical protein